MPKNDIGGFFVSLGLNADKHSFETGNKLIDTVANSFNKLIGAARNAAVVLAGTAIATGQVESAAYKTAEKIGISTETLDLWKASAKIAGVDANGLVSAMGKLSSVMGRMRIDGAGLDQFSKKLGELGLVTDKIDLKKMLDMAPDELMTDIIRKAQEASAKAKGNSKEQQRIAIIVGDILGEAGQDFYLELQRQGKTIDEFKAGAGRTVFTTAADNQKGANFAVEANTLKTELESMGKLLGDSIGGELTPYLKELNDWIQKNGPEIKDEIKNISDAVGKIVNKIAPGVSMAASAVNGYVQAGATLVNEGPEAAGNKLYETLEVINAKYNGESIEENRARRKRQEEEHKRIEELIAADPAPTHRKALSWRKHKSELKPELQKEIDKYLEEFGTGWNFSDSIRMQDGIMRPDGTVTQVAPDDWVFAARNVGDLARAFIPQNFGQATVSAPSEYVINQTFNISGSSDMPQVLRQQAYRGTQEGLLEIMNQSSQRMQLMSGTR